MNNLRSFIKANYKNLIFSYIIVFIISCFIAFYFNQIWEKNSKTITNKKVELKIFPLSENETLQLNMFVNSLKNFDSTMGYTEEREENFPDKLKLIEQYYTQMILYGSTFMIEDDNSNYDFSTFFKIQKFNEPLVHILITNSDLRTIPLLDNDQIAKSLTSFLNFNNQILLESTKNFLDSIVENTSKQYNSKMKLIDTNIKIIEENIEYTQSAINKLKFYNTDTNSSLLDMNIISNIYGDYSMQLRDKENLSMAYNAMKELFEEINNSEFYNNSLVKYEVNQLKIQEENDSKLKLNINPYIIFLIFFIILFFTITSFYYFFYNTTRQNQ